MRSEDVSPLEHHLRALGDRNLAPRLEGAVCRVDGLEDLVLRARRNLCNPFARRRVRYRKPLLRFGVFPFAVYTIFHSFYFAHNQYSFFTQTICMFMNLCMNKIAVQ